MPSVTGSEILDVIKEEQVSHHSSLNINNAETKCDDCVCKNLPSEVAKQSEDLLKKADVDKMLQERDAQLRKQFEHELEAQISLLKERFDFILTNEQIRTSYMLREAHRERQEKVVALQSQLECKNMAGLMYVMCSERRRGKLEKLKLIEEYTGYIHALQSILTEGQELILNLSRGYKTATRVDHEWREKMKKIIHEFQAYVVNYNGGTPESNQYIFDIPLMLKTNSPVVDDPKEDPCEAEGEEEGEGEKSPEDDDVPWWEQLEGDCRPFIMFGDLCDFSPSQRRETLKTIKATKTAPKKWKHYLFNEMYLKSDCSNLDKIKDEQPNRFPMQATWECHAAQTLNREESVTRSKYNFSTHRLTSMDARGNMGSILKIITAGHITEPITKANLLGARDSMEITSTTKLKEKIGKSSRSAEKINVGLGQRKYDGIDQGLKSEAQKKSSEPKPPKSPIQAEDDEEEESGSQSLLGSIHNDSLQIINGHRPDLDHKINYEKVCPIDKCKRMEMDSFTRSLPPYMRASPFMHFEQTFENYETCSPDQIELLQARLELKKKKNKSQATLLIEDDILEEWAPEIEGVGVQTSESKLYLPPCTCELPMSSASTLSGGGVYRLEDLLPIKRALDEIQEKCFFDDEIQFNRFEVLGHDSDVKLATQQDFDKKRMTEIYRILKKHPSLCDLFQANTS